MRSLTANEIDKFIQDDQIVWVSCRKPTMPLLQGKFVRSSATDEDGQYTYSFCPYKRHASMPFLPADAWMISDKESKEAQSSAISEALKNFK